MVAASAQLNMHFALGAWFRTLSHCAFRCHFPLLDFSYFPEATLIGFTGSAFVPGSLAIGAGFESAFSACEEGIDVAEIPIEICMYADDEGC